LAAWQINASFLLSHNGADTVKVAVLVACLSIRTAAQTYWRNFNLPNYKHELYAKVCYSIADTSVTLTE